MGNLIVSVIPEVFPQTVLKLGKGLGKSGATAKKGKFNIRNFIKQEYSDSRIIRKRTDQIDLLTH